MKVEVIPNSDDEENYKKIELVAETRRESIALTNLCYSEIYKEKYLRRFTSEGGILRDYKDAVIYTNSTGEGKGIKSVGLMVYW